MFRPGRFERRLLVALVLFSAVPALALVGLGTLVLREAVSLQTTPAGWERLGTTGRELLEAADRSADEQLREAAQVHREELTNSIQQAQRWGYLNRRVLVVLPWIALGLLLALMFLAARAARNIAHGLARPIQELTLWSGLVARGEPLPAPLDEERKIDEFAVLRESFRSMDQELAKSRQRDVEAARMRMSVSLARGVAHELKNALTPLRLATRSLRAGAANQPLLLDPLEVIESESQRLESLARSFAQFGRPPEGPRSRIDLVELLLHVTRTHLPPGISLDASFPAEALWIDGYHDALSRCFANLILNSVEAMGERGTLSESAGAEVGGAIVVRIRDSGPGLPPGFEDRLWDPDFTTKPRGTGLGLALVRQTLHAHGAEITARTVETGGAEFVITFPAAPPASPDGQDNPGEDMPESAVARHRSAALSSS